MTLAVLVSIALIMTAYTVSAYYVASYVSEFPGSGGHLFWPDTLGGSFLPWPCRPTGIAGMMFTELDQEDYFYYNYVIKSGVLIALTLLLWVIVLWRVWTMKRAHLSN